MTDGSTQKQQHYQIVVIGGGAAGITVISQLLKQQPNLDIALIEPSDKHYYQPGWTLVGAGVFRFEETVKDQKDCLPQGTRWIRDAVEQLAPDENSVITKTGLTITYDYLIVCPGIQLDWNKITGLPETLGRNGVTSNYDAACTNYTWELIDGFSGGRAIFTYPDTPIKCAGAPQKIMYLADDTFKRKSGVGSNSEVIFCTPGSKIFAVPTYETPLKAIIERRGIQVKTNHTLIAIEGEARIATFAVETEGRKEEVSLPYDLIHVTPPMSAPDFIKKSPLAVNGPGGWVDVDKHTLQHVRYPNVFSLGDASSLPTSKTAAAVRGEAPVLVANLLAFRESKPLLARYNGYACCPLITGYNYTIMAEFDYDKQPLSSFLINPAKERWSMWLVKKHLLPWVYWNRMLKGHPHESAFFKPFKSLVPSAPAMP